MRRSLAFAILACLGTSANAANFDGTYNGNRTTSGSKDYCHEMAVSMTISGGHLKYNHTNPLGQVIAPFDLTIGADGAFIGSAKGRANGDHYGAVMYNISGQITGASISANISNSACIFTLNLTKAS